MMMIGVLSPFNIIMSYQDDGRVVIALCNELN